MNDVCFGTTQCSRFSRNVELRWLLLRHAPVNCAVRLQWNERWTLLLVRVDDMKKAYVASHCPSSRIVSCKNELNRFHIR